MFDSCSTCRRRLAKRAEGNLPRYQWAALEAHLNRCPTCRRIDEADRCLHMALSMRMMSSARLNHERAAAFDDRVLNLVTNQPRSPWRGFKDRLIARLRYLRMGAAGMFMTQVAGGALVAASITAAAMLLAMPQYGAPVHLGAEHGASAHSRQASNTRWVTGPPVPMETLLNSPTPRAALLWTEPASGEHATASTSKSESGKLRERMLDEHSL